MPFFSNVGDRLSLIEGHFGEHELEMVTMMGQLHILEQLEGAIHGNQRDLILEILSSPELHALGKRSQRLTHQILLSAIQMEDNQFFRAILHTKAWGVNTYLNDTHSYLIHTVSQLPDESFLRILFEENVDLESLDPTTNQTALHFAVRANLPSTVRLLLANFSNVDALDSTDRTPAMLASHLGHFECLELLLCSGINPNTGFSSHTESDKKVSLLKEVLISQISPSHRQCIKCLLEHGALRPQNLGKDQFQLISDCAFDLFQFMCFAEPTAARHTAIGLSSLFCSVKGNELQQLQDLLSSVNNEKRERTTTRRAFKLLESKRGISIKPTVFEKTFSESQLRTPLKFTLKNHSKNELTAVLLLPKSFSYQLICPTNVITIKPGSHIMVVCDVILTSQSISTVAIVIEIETPTFIEFHYVIARFFPVSNSSQTI